jgi:hypothetical protein
VYDGAEFNGTISSLQIALPPKEFSTDASNALTSFPPVDALAYPPNRFGFNTTNPSPLLGSPTSIWTSPFGGQPREYGTGGWWVGRLTMEETSDNNWDYPQLTHTAPTGAADASNKMNTAFAWDDNNAPPFVIDNFDGGPRRGEDLLLANVHAFDVKVWDDKLGQFVDVGHSLPAVGGLIGDYHRSNRLNVLYGPDAAATPTSSNNRVFDTWYPFRHRDANGNGTFDPIEPSTDPDGDGIIDMADLPATATTNDRQTLDVNADGTIFVEDRNGDSAIDAGECFPPYRPLQQIPVNAVANGSRVDYERYVPVPAGAATRYSVGDHVFPPINYGGTQWGDPFYYVCVNWNDVNGDGSVQRGPGVPTWPRIAGLNSPDGELTWQAVDNRKPLRAIQITLRFLDPSTQQMRTLTIQHSLVK